MGKLREYLLGAYYDEKRKRNILAALIALAGAVALITGAIISADRNRPAERYEEEGLVELSYAWFSSDFSNTHRETIYQIVRQDNETRLYVNGKKEGTCDYKDQSQAISFDLNPSEASNEALTMEDSETGVGEDIYHLKKSVAQEYLKYLQQVKGYQLCAYCATSKVWDAYLQGQNQKETIRFMYIYETQAEGILICATTDNNAEYPGDLAEWGFGVLVDS